MKHLLISAAAFAAVTTLQLLPAGAIAIVLGGRAGHMTALPWPKAGVDPHRGISYCDEALDNELLGRYDRAATYHQRRGVMKIALERYHQRDGRL